MNQITELNSSDAKRFVDAWAAVWRDHDGEAWPDLLAEGCVLRNPMGAVGRDELTAYMAGLVGGIPEHQIKLLRWGPTSDGVLIEWLMSGRLPGGTIEIEGVDRFTLVDGRATDGVAYFDPRPLIDGLSGSGNGAS